MSKDECMHKRHRLRILCYIVPQISLGSFLSLGDNAMKLGLSLNQSFFFSTYIYQVFIIKKNLSQDV